MIKFNGFLKTMKKKFFLLIFAALFFTASIFAQPMPPRSIHQSLEQTLIMATGTGPDNSGFLAYLALPLKQETGIHLKWTSVASGQALDLGRQCQADILLVNSPAAEQPFMQQKFGMVSYPLMFDDFVIVGPSSDPAGLRGTTPIRAFQLIKFKLRYFVSRDDDSGTYTKEKELWNEARLIVPRRPNWYYRSYQGMMATLIMANQLNAYTLTDRATFLKFKEKNPYSSLQILSQDPASLQNIYHLIIVNPSLCPNIHLSTAKMFVTWITSSEGQTLIKNYKINGQLAFTPDAQPVIFPRQKNKLYGK